MASAWPTFALWWYGRPSATLLAGADHAVDPILGRPVAFYMFTLPAWEAIAGWLVTVAVLLLVLAVFSAVVSRGGGVFARRRAPEAPRGLALTWALFLLALSVAGLARAIRAAAGGPHDLRRRDVHRRPRPADGIAIVAALLVLGALAAASAGVTRRSLVWLAAAAAPAAIAYLLAGAVASYVSGFIVKPNELVREASVHRAQHRVHAAGVRSQPDRGAAVSGGGRPSRRRILPPTPQRCRTSGSGTGVSCRTRCGSCRRSAPTTTSRISTSIATRSTACRGR